MPVEETPRLAGIGAGLLVSELGGGSEAERASKGATLVLVDEPEWARQSLIEWSVSKQ